MNLDNITPQGYILAMIIRDDGERILLGDGAYAFKDSQQHFQPNTFANDVVELQGTDGQLLAGQVRRTAIQTFAGYIGDASTSQQRVEQYRKQFLMFFRKKFHYTAVYIFHDGSAIQRKRGYIAAAPAVPELYQKYPEWSVGLNFEDANYYEYAEDDEGNEIYAHAVQIAISNAVSGGLIWDNNGATSDDLGYTGTPIDGNGKNFQLTNTSDKILKSAELLGDAEQTTYSGKNLFDYTTITNVLNGTNNGDGSVKSITWTNATWNGITINCGAISIAQQFVVSMDIRLTSGSTGTFTKFNDGTNNFHGVTVPTVSTSWQRYAFNYTPASGYSLSKLYVQFSAIDGSFEVKNIQIELAQYSTAYEPYVGGTASPNPDYPQAVNVVTGEQTVEVVGKNLFDKDNANVLNAYLSTMAGVILANSTDRVVWLKINKNSTYTVSLTQKALSTATSVDDFAVGIYTTQPQIGSSGTRLAYTPRQSATADEAFSLTFDSGANEYVAIKVANTSKTDFNATLATLQLELGSQTAYEPYQGQTKPVNLGKNLYTDTMRQGVTYYNTNQYSASDTTRITGTNWMNIPAGTYTINAKTPLSKTVNVSTITFDMNEQFYSLPISGAWKSVPFTFTIPVDLKIKYNIRFTDNSAITPSNITDIQLEKGSQATPYAPVLVTKNQCYNSNYVSSTSLELFCRCSEIKSNNYVLSAITDATVSGASVYSFVDGTDLHTSVGTFTGTANQRGSAVLDLSSIMPQIKTGQVLRFLIYKSGAGFSSIKDAMIEEGSSMTPYEPYGTPIELVKIGTYQDRIYKTGGKWYIEKQIARYVADGSNDETWGVANSGSANWLYYTYITGTGAGETSSNSQMSNIGQWTSITGNNTNQGIQLVSGNLLRVRLGTEQSTADWRAFLGTTNMIVYYVLTTPTTTEITNQALIDQLNSLQHANTYTNLTNFSTSSVYLNGFLSVKAYPKGSTPTGGYIWEAGGAGGPTTLTVDGVDNAYPIWTVPGPATNPTLTNITTGQTISWTGTVPNGQELVIDMANQTASLSGANVFEFVSGSWLTLEPGNNRISYSAINATDPSKLEWNGVTG